LLREALWSIARESTYFWRYFARSQFNLHPRDKNAICTGFFGFSAFRLFLIVGRSPVKVHIFDASTRGLSFASTDVKKRNRYGDFRRFGFSWFSVDRPSKYICLTRVCGESFSLPPAWKT
jgi:hypothetical protein